VSFFRTSLEPCTRGLISLAELKRVNFFNGQHKVVTAGRKVRVEGIKLSNPYSVKNNTKIEKESVIKIPLKTHFSEEKGTQNCLLGPMLGF
jgi:hypothetical protein